MEKFKPGDIVYHKATLVRGVISAKMVHSERWMITWEDGKKDNHTEAELYTEQEHSEKHAPGV